MQKLNTLVEDLSIQAGLACDGTDFDDAAIQLFTEMIVKDCIREFSSCTHQETEFIARILLKRYGVTFTVAEMLELFGSDE